jgi:hypothetical protein
LYQPICSNNNWLDEVHQLPHFMHDYFMEVIDVADDEHCAFRVVSCLLDKYDEDHQIICLELTIIFLVFTTS